jgi:hypothetical protein
LVNFSIALNVSVFPAIASSTPPIVRGDAVIALSDSIPVSINYTIVYIYFIIVRSDKIIVLIYITNVLSDRIIVLSGCTNFKSSPPIVSGTCILV